MLEKILENWNDILSIAVGIVGVLGFVLSVLLAIFSARQNRLRMFIDSVQIIPTDDLDIGVDYMIYAIIANKSLLPVSILGVNVEYEKVAFHSSTKVLRYDYIEGGELFIFSLTTPLPTLLPSFGAKRFVFAMERQENQPQKEMPPHLELDNHSDRQLSLEFQTSRRGITKRVKCRPLSREAYLKYRVAFAKASSGSDTSFFD